MKNTIQELNKDLYQLETYQDKDGNKILFDLFFIEEREESHLSQFIVQASIDGEIAGYMSILYLSDTNKSKYFNSAWDYYYHKKMPLNLKTLFDKKDNDFFKKVHELFNVKLDTQEEFKHFAEKFVENEYKKLLSFYWNKPYPEIVTVYSEQDKKFKDFSDFPFMSYSRKNINFLGKGIANAIYHCACHILKKENLYLYESNNQTLDGKRMWSRLEKNPKFLTLSDTYYDTLTTNRNNIIELERKKITI